MHNWIGLIVLVGIVGAMGLFLWRSIKLKSGGDGAPDSNFSSNWSGSDHHPGTDGHSGTQ